MITWLCLDSRRHSREYAMLSRTCARTIVVLLIHLALIVQSGCSKPKGGRTLHQPIVKDTLTIKRESISNNVSAQAYGSASGQKKSNASSATDISKRLDHFTDALAFLASTNYTLVNLGVLTNKHSAEQLLDYIKHSFVKNPSGAKVLCEFLLETATNSSIRLDVSDFYLGILHNIGDAQDVGRAYGVLDTLQSDYRALPGTRSIAVAEHYLNAMYAYANTLADVDRAVGVAQLIEACGADCLPVERAYADFYFAVNAMQCLDFRRARELLTGIRSRGAYGRQNATKDQVDQFLNQLDSHLGEFAATISQAISNPDERVPRFGGMRRAKSTNQ